MNELASGNIVAIAVGNTRTRIGVFVPRGGGGSDLRESVSVVNTDMDAVAARVMELADGMHGVPMVMSSVNAKSADVLEARLREFGEVYRFGRDLPIAMATTLDDEKSVGQDRLLCALGAFSKSKQACVVVDAGTAITVDFVDGEGVFQGGVIAPGLHMMLASLHERTAALPKLALEKPDAARGVFGKDTTHAMLLGVRCAAVGLVRYVVEQYAQAYEAYPQIVATGGDAAMLFDGDEVVEHIVPDLQLLGVLEACKRVMDDEYGDTGDANEGANDDGDEA